MSSCENQEIWNISCKWPNFSSFLTRVSNSVDKLAFRMDMTTQSSILTMYSRRCKSRTNSTQCVSSQSCKASSRVKMQPSHSSAPHSQERPTRFMAKPAETVASFLEQLRTSYPSPKTATILPETTPAASLKTSERTLTLSCQSTREINLACIIKLESNLTLRIPRA